MVKMEKCCLTEYKYQQLRQEIEQRHLIYLDLEESPEKLEQRNRLEEYIHEFLCISGHYHKFVFQETQEVLQISANYKKDFSPYKASLGFNAIQMYAGNLISQPWRKEYRQLKTYCGFYKHQVEANLVRAEKVFEAMGYRFCGDGLFVLDDPICPDRVIAVSLDCLVAYMECQIIISIWEELSKSFKISWTEILDFRKNHICTPEQCINVLKSRHIQREHPRSLSQSSNSLRSPMVPMNHSFPPPTIGLPLPHEYFVNGNVGQCRNIVPYNPILMYNIPPVPTANLIEVDTVDAPRISEFTEQQENWDYVYRNLENQGYSKDLGERGDLLSPKPDKEVKKIKNTNIDEAFTQLRVNDKPTKSNPTLEDSTKLKIPKLLREKKKVAVVKNPDRWSCKSCTYLNDSIKEICEMCGKSRNPKSDAPIEVGGAECSKCTLVNSKSNTVCDACGTSLAGSPTYI